MNISSLAKCVVLLLLTSLYSCSAIVADYEFQQGVSLYNKGDWEKAAKHLSKAAKLQTDKESKKRTYTALGNVYNEWGKYDSSLVYHMEALEIDPDYADALVNIGIVYRLIGEFEMAESSYEKARAVEPDDPYLLASLGSLYVYQGKIKEAIGVLEKSLEIEDGYGVSHANYAVALAKDGQFLKAEKSLQTAIELGYENGEIVEEMIEEIRQEELGKDL